MPETTALGAAMAAGAAEGVNVWSLDDEQLGNITTDTFTPSVTKKGNVPSSPWWQWLPVVYNVVYWLS